MARVGITHACLLASTAGVLLASVTLPGSAPAQTATATTSNAATGSAAGRPRGPVDPGVRGGDAGAGGALANLTDAERAYFNAAKDVFEEVDGVAEGLGPRFNLDGCTGCHSQPATGGSSPPTNPQVAVATANGAQNVLPSFISENGPV